jgi:aspartate racemase
MKNKAIGVIGGMGPVASARFYELLAAIARKEFGAQTNDGFPEIYLASIPVPDFIASEKQKSQALQMLVERIKLMDNLPISFYCLACNTGHLLLTDLEKATKRPFVSLLDEVPMVIQKLGLTRVGLLASPVTVRTGLYAKMEVELILPSDQEVKLLGKIIKETIAGKNQEQNAVLVQQIAKKLLDRGAQGILEGCTEIPLIFPRQHLIPVFDTLEILAKAVLKRYYLNGRKND